MDNECKAWESNVDATYEGNNRDGGCAPNNWGSCGFQRHFPWKEFTLTGEAAALSMTGFTGLDFNTAPAGLLAPFNAGNTFLTTTSTLYNLGGLPFLGGMCKLFIPVPPASIVQVQVAGVHKQGTSFAQFPARATANSIALSGTAYCFSVVNVHETRDNTNNVNNGNVAGYGVGGTNGRTDVFDGLNSLARQAGVAFGGAYGTALTSQGDVDLGTAAEGEVKAGNNFDVVAHFADAWCESGKWSTVKMLLSATLTTTSRTSVTILLVTVISTRFPEPTAITLSVPKSLLTLHPLLHRTWSAGQTAAPGPVTSPLSFAPRPVP